MEIIYFGERYLEECEGVNSCICNMVVKIEDFIYKSNLLPYIEKFINEENFYNIKSIGFYHYRNHGRGRGRVYGFYHYDGRIEVFVEESDVEKNNYARIHETLLHEKGHHIKDIILKDDKIKKQLKMMWNRTKMLCKKRDFSEFFSRMYAFSKIKNIYPKKKIDEVFQEDMSEYYYYNDISRELIKY